MDLKELVKEVDYQVEYSYEKRVDLLNEYAISTSQKYFNPIYELGKFILGNRRISEWSTNTDKIDYGQFNSCYSHSGAVISSFNSQSKEASNKNSSVRIIKDSIFLYGRFYPKDVSVLKPILSFDLIDKTFSIRNDCYTVKIKRDIYDLIDKWLIDFGYEKW